MKIFPFLCTYKQKAIHRLAGFLPSLWDPIAGASNARGSTRKRMVDSGDPPGKRMLVLWVELPVPLQSLCAALQNLVRVFTAFVLYEPLHACITRVCLKSHKEIYSVRSLASSVARVLSMSWVPRGARVRCPSRVLLTQQAGGASQAGPLPSVPHQPQRHQAAMKSVHVDACGPHTASHRFFFFFGPHCTFKENVNSSNI